MHWYFILIRDKTKWYRKFHYSWSTLSGCLDFLVSLVYFQRKLESNFLNSNFRDWRKMIVPLWFRNCINLSHILFYAIFQRTEQLGIIVKKCKLPVLIIQYPWGLRKCRWLFFWNGISYRRKFQQMPSYFNSRKINWENELYFTLFCF